MDFISAEIKISTTYLKIQLMMEYEQEYICFKLSMLNRERSTILQRGALSEEQDDRLTEIDAEVSLYLRFLNGQA